MTNFGDLVKEDSVFLVCLGPLTWDIHALKILDAKFGLNDVKLILENEGWSGYYPKNLCSARTGFIWSDKEEALKYALGTVKKEREYLNRTIDDLISKYDKLEKFIEKYGNERLLDEKI